MLYKIGLRDSKPRAWSSYLENAVSGQEYCFAVAHQCCQSINQRSLVDFVHGRFFLDAHKFEVAARYLLLQSIVSFEEVALLFLQSGKTNALATLLAAKMGILSYHDKTQATITSTWSVEILLCQMMTANSEVCLTDSDLNHIFGNQQAALHDEVTCNLLTSHGSESSYFNKTHEQAVNYFLCEKRWSELLSVLDAVSVARADSMLYNTSLQLLQNASVPTIVMWTHKPLNSVQLLPALLRHGQFDSTVAARCCEYLQGCMTYSSIEAAVETYFLILTADIDSATRLFTLSYELFQLQSTLRICSNRRCVRSCAWIYASLALYEEAVTLALTIDVQLAKEYANLPAVETVMKRRLWLMIAEHITYDRSYAIVESAQILEDCQMLSIEDILRFFPDFVVIEAFKTEICSSLEQYNKSLDTLRAEINDYKHNSINIQNESLTLYTQDICLASNARCSLSGCPVVSEPFFYFSSGHSFLERNLTKAKRKELSVTPHTNTIENGKAQRQGLPIAAECPLTGSTIIDSVDIPLYFISLPE
mmetsp:Transcript_28908/g.94645  ORF Transcript_28908/g.94645 Transcript_28908/m.94645 type:complete len:535 (+) Transcript_28908:262-1866(+)